MPTLNAKPNPSDTDPLPATDPFNLPVPVKKLVEMLNGSVTEGGLRWDFFNRDSNGLAESGALIFRGRRILVIPNLYLRWMIQRGQRRSV